MKLEVDARVGSGNPHFWRRLGGGLLLFAMLAAAFIAGLEDPRVLLGGEYANQIDPGTPISSLLLELLLYALLPLAAILYLSTLRASAPSPGELARVEVTGEALTIQTSTTRRTIPLADLTDGWIDGGRGVVIRVRRGELLTLATGSEARNAALLSAVLLDERQRVARLPIGSLAAALPGGRLLGWTAFLMAIPTTLWSTTRLGAALAKSLGFVLEPAVLHALADFAGPAAALFLLWAALRRRQVVVGSDGLRVEGLVRRRWIPYAALRGVEPRDDGGVRLRRFRWLSVVLPGAPGGEGLYRRISQVMDARRDRALDPHGDALERRGRSRAEWVAALRALLDHRATYRGSPIQADDLAAMVGDASLPPERRVAAAVSLSASRDEEARQRIRIAAEACADEDLRAALEQAAEGEIAEDALARATRRAGR